MILLIDNYDSFTFNIFQYLKVLDYPVLVKRNDKIDVAGVEKLSPSHIIISPGPGRPKDAGNVIPIIKQFQGRVPILGICLGHQCIGEALGARVVHAKELYHGRESEISHNMEGVFNGLSSPLSVIRYHSLVIEKISLPKELEITALSEDGEIMAIAHRSYSLEGVQFHPESIGTKSGREMIKNFIEQKPIKPTIQTSIKKVYSGSDLSEEEAERVMAEITNGDATPSQIAGILTAIGLKGESVSELTGFVKVMRDKAISIQTDTAANIVDTCGTGGDSSGTFNISTVSAFVAAGAGVTIAKHGNRSVTSRCGSADVLETLGVNIMVSPDTMAEALNSIGISFLFAPSLHPSMKQAVAVRRELGIPTAFNILGPLSNPASADCQLIGVFDRSLLEKVAKVLIRIGVKRAMVVNGEDGLDEITLTGQTFVSEIRDGWLKNYSLTPGDFGLDKCRSQDLKGGDLKTNCEIALAILNNEPGPARDSVLMNAAAAIYVSGQTDSFKQGVLMARDSISSGAALEKLNGLVEITSF